jgi:two-component system, response regulator PdtaR
LRILIAEDETLIRIDLRQLLEEAGHQVCAEATTGLEAVHLARRESPDAAIIDVKMPELDGVEAARIILEERPIPIVIVSAYTERALVMRAVEGGAYGYLAKPFRGQDVLPAMATAQARFGELQDARSEVETLAEALAARKAIERAKGILMLKEQLSEADAFTRLRRASQASGKPMRVIAEALIDTLGQPT